MPHVLFLTTRQTTEIRNAFANSTWTDMKLSKAQIYKAIQSVGFFGSCLDRLRKKVVTDFASPFARDKLSGSVSNAVSNAASNAINTFERRISGKRAVRTGKGFALFISNEDMNDIIKIIKSLKGLGVLIDGVTKTVKHEIKKNKNMDFLVLC